MDGRGKERISSKGKDEVVIVEDKKAAEYFAISKKKTERTTETFCYFNDFQGELCNTMNALGFG